MEGQSAAPVRGTCGACGRDDLDAFRPVLRLRDLTVPGGILSS